MIPWVRKNSILCVLPGLLTALDLAAAPSPPTIEPGLEKAVRWKWQVEPSDIRSWGYALHAVPVLSAPMQPSSPGVPMPHPLAGQPDSYVVKRGDALYTIGKRFKVPVDLLKSVNGLANNTIHIGQMLRIPSPQEVAAARPAPTATPIAPGATPAPAALSPEQMEMSTLLLQVFLDREGFSSGPINARGSFVFDKVLQLYKAGHPGVAEAGALIRKAQAAVGDPFAKYTLRVEDFRFIAPPQAEKAAPTPAPAAKRKKAEAPVFQQARPTYGQLTAVTMLAYRTPWEFVAERFHCDEAYLRKLNPQLGSLPAAGSEFRVPDVAPFEIERALYPPLQPAADAQTPVTAAVIDLSLLAISRGGNMIAVMPVSMARPGLRGRDAWKIQEAIPRPQLISRQELLVPPQPPTRIYGTAEPTPTPSPTPIPPAQRLAAGPRNPVGIIWINLTKADSSEILPYGLHGTSIPDHMATQQGLGGIRMTNWDIARAMRLLPVGTTLEWKDTRPKPGAAVPVARPAM